MLTSVSSVYLGQGAVSGGIYWSPCRASLRTRIKNSDQEDVERDSFSDVYVLLRIDPDHKP